MSDNHQVLLLIVALFGSQAAVGYWIVWRIKRGG